MNRWNVSSVREVFDHLGRSGVPISGMLGNGYTLNWNPPSKFSTFGNYNVMSMGVDVLVSDHIDMIISSLLYYGVIDP